METTMLSVNVNDHTEKKGQLTYLSWAWAWAEVLKFDPVATWHVHRYVNGGMEQPCMWIGETAMVHTTVTIKGQPRECMLPVMDHKNNAMKNPDARKISDAIMRCMTKAVSMHGLGLYIYAGEDLPQASGDDDHAPTPAPAPKPRGQSTLAAAAEDNPIPDDEKPFLDELAMDMTDAFQKDGAEAAYELMAGKELDVGHKLYLSTRLATNVRNAVKKVSFERRAVPA